MEEPQPEPQSHGATSMADAMAHVLAKKPKKTGAPILSRSKSTIEKIQEEKKERRQKKLDKRNKKAIIDSCRLQSSAYSIDVEKKLVRVATRGTVTLFNAVRKAQKGGEEAVEKASKVQSLSKGAFLDMLKGVAKADIEEEKSEKSGKKWDVLGDDYMMGSGMKQWKKDEAGEGEVPEDVSDFDSDSEVFEGESEQEIEDESEDD